MHLFQPPTGASSSSFPRSGATPGREPQETAALDLEFCWQVPAGLLVSLRIPPLPRPWPEAALSSLPESERAEASRLGARRARQFLGGRLALHAAARRAGRSLGPVLRTPPGAPRLPAGVSASISHKHLRAVALLAEAPGLRVGVDVEALCPARPAIARMVLAPPAWQALSGLDEAARWRAVLARFSLKEALYKALPPAWQRGFRMAQCQVPDPVPLQASGPVTLHLEGLADGVRGHVWWLEDAVLTAVWVPAATLAGGAPGRDDPTP